MLNEKTIVSGVSLIASLATYFYARDSQRDVVPYVMVGGFIGAIVGEAIAGIVINEDKKKDKKKDNEHPEKNK
jgi:hypothetical protein